jgi:hypothetical protein
MSAVRRPRPRWRVTAPLVARVGRPIDFEWPGTLDHATVEGADTRDTIYLVMAPDSLAAKGRFWPRHAGPHQLAGGGDTLRFLVSPSGSWEGPHAGARLARTALHAALHAPRGEPGGAVRVTKTIPSWLFWALFVPAAGWLWWERRRNWAAGKEGRTGVG